MALSSSKSGRFVAYTVSFCLGVIAGFFIFETRISNAYLLWLLIPVPFLVVFWRSSRVRFFVFLILFLFFGVFRSGIALPDDTPIRNMANARTRIVASGYVAGEPLWKDGKMQYVISFDKPKARVWAMADPHPVLPYGTSVSVSCTLMLPQRSAGFAFDRFAAMRGIDALCLRPQIKRVEIVAGSRIYSTLLDAKSRVQSVIDKTLPEPHASFLGGLLYGARSTIPEDLSEAFNRTGTTHIIAISGYNITLVSSLFMTVLLGLGIRRQRAFWVSSGAIVLFVLLVGAQASVVRAAIMAMVLLLSMQWGRVSKGAPLLALAALAMVFHNPYALLYDVGFQLSFAAVIGLMYLSKDLERFFSIFPETISAMLAQTLAAIVLTSPLIMYYFGRISAVAPFVNALILPAIPTIMFLGFFAVMFTFLARPIGLLLFWLCWVLLSYVIGVVRFMASFSFSSVSAQLSLVALIGSYAVLFYLVKMRYEQQ